MKNTSPHSKQRIMNDIISTNNLECVFSYLDDLLVTGKTLGEHDKNLERLLDAVKNQNIILNKEKCVWRKDHIQFLGYSIGHGEVKPDEGR